MDEQVPMGSRTGGWIGVVALVLGLTTVGVCGGILGSQMLHVKWQLERQQRVKALVQETGLPRSFVPKIQTDNRWAIGGSTGVVFGFFWFVWGLVRYRDQQQSTALVRDPDCGVDAPAGALPQDVTRFPTLHRLRQLPTGPRLRLTPEITRRAAEPLLEMGGHLDAVLALPGLQEHGRALSTTRRLPRAYFTHMTAALAAFDRFTDSVVEHTPLAVTCGPGCTACCHSMPAGLHGCELLVLYRNARRLPDFRELHNRAVSCSDRFRRDLRRASICIATTVQTDSRVFRRASERYMRRRLPCVFVDQDTGRCRVYASRPIACRMHLSVSHPQWCWPDHLRSRHAITPNLAPPPPIAARLDDIDRALGLDHITRLLLPGFTEVSRTLFAGKPLRVTSGARPARRRSKHRNRR